MPREVVHWHILRSAGERLGNEHPVAILLRQQRAASELGAVMHDAAYYLEAGRSELIQVSNLLHGSRKGDPSAALGSALTYLQQESGSSRRAVALAFLFGMFSHAIADAVFHPFVFFFTGEYHDADTSRRRRAQRRHRVLEVYLDMYVLAAADWRGMRIDARLRELAPEKDAILALFEHALFPGLRAEFPACEEVLLKERDVVHAANLYKGLDDMAFYQKVFLNRPAGSIAKVLASLFPERFAALEALFLHGREREFRAVLMQEFTYQNPVSGEVRQERVDSLLERAIAETARLFESFTPVLEGRDYDQTVYTELLKGRSLNYGIRSAPLGSASYFSDRGIDLPDLRFSGREQR